MNTRNGNLVNLVTMALLMALGREEQERLLKGE